MKERIAKSTSRSEGRVSRNRGSMQPNSDSTKSTGGGQKAIPRRWIFLSVVAAYGVIRLLLLWKRGYVSDLRHYQVWMARAVRFGVANIYETSRMDYPPLFIYILAPLGRLYAWFEPGALEGLHHSKSLTALIKLPPLIFDLGIGWMLYRWTLWRSHVKSAALVVAAAYLLNPAVLFDDAYWGAPDSIHSFFILAAFMTLGLGLSFWVPGGQDAASDQERNGHWLVWIFLTLAISMKPLAAPFFPLLFVLSYLVYGTAKTLVGILAAVITTVVLFSPFLLTGQGTQVFRRVLVDAGKMPFTSANAHNLWWFIGAWRKADVPWLGSLTATHVALILFGAAYAILLWKGFQLHRRQTEGIRPAQLIALSAMVGFSFFMLATHLHENHLFMALPLFAALLLEGRVWRWLFAGVSVALLANLLLHDLSISKRWPFTIGGTLSAQHVDLHRPFFATEMLFIWVSTIFNLVLYFVAMTGVVRGKWLERLGAVKATA